MSQCPVVDYTAKSNLAVYATWQENSRNPAMVLKIINLVWTYIAANAVVGTWGWQRELVSGTDENFKRNLDERQ